MEHRVVGYLHLHTFLCSIYYLFIYLFIYVFIYLFIYVLEAAGNNVLLAEDNK